MKCNLTKFVLVLVKKILPFLLILLPIFLSFLWGHEVSQPVRLRYSFIQFDRKFRCDGSPGIKIAIHDLQVEELGGYHTRFRLRFFQNNTELEELRVDLPENQIFSLPATFSGESLWFCLADYLLEEFSDPQQEYAAIVELLETETEAILWKASFKFRR